jgi:prepilin-type processing-associated H-X9-DG protein
MLADLEAPFWPYGLIYPRMYYYSIGWPSNRHAGVANVAFCDGHVEVLRRTAIWGTEAAERAHLLPPWNRLPEYWANWHISAAGSDPGVVRVQPVVVGRDAGIRA